MKRNELSRERRSLLVAEYLEQRHHGSEPGGERRPCLLPALGPEEGGAYFELHLEVVAEQFEDPGGLSPLERRRGRTLLRRLVRTDELEHLVHAPSDRPVG